MAENHEPGAMTACQYKTIPSTPRPLGSTSTPSRWRHESPLPLWIATSQFRVTSVHHSPSLLPPDTEDVSEQTDRRGEAARTAVITTSGRWKGSLSRNPRSKSKKLAVFFCCFSSLKFQGKKEALIVVLGSEKKTRKKKKRQEEVITAKLQQCSVGGFCRSCWQSWWCWRCRRLRLPPCPPPPLCPRPLRTSTRKCRAATAVTWSTPPPPGAPTPALSNSTPGPTQGRSGAATPLKVGRL